MNADILIVTYNSAAVIDGCIAACLQLTASRVLVVDNASSDDTLARIPDHPRVEVIRNRHNRGFAGAVNQGIARSGESIVLVLNPDAILTTPIDSLIQRFGDSRTGAVAGRLLNEDGSDQSRFQLRNFPTAKCLAFEVLGVNRLWPSNPVNRKYRRTSPLTESSEVEQPAGAFLAIRSESWKGVGGFDEFFWPVWFEDVDFCLRLRRAGWSIWFEPAVTARHAGGDSVSRIDWGRMQVYWYVSLLKYASKHYERGGRRVVGLAVMLASLPRMLAGIVSQKSFRPVKVFSEIGLFAARFVFAGEDSQSVLEQGDRKAAAVRSVRAV